MLVSGTEVKSARAIHDSRHASCRTDGTCTLPIPSIGASRRRGTRCLPPGPSGTGEIRNQSN